MELVIARCAGLDVHQATVVATVRTPDDRGGRRRTTETFGTMTPDLLALREWLQAHGVTHVALESTGVYWKPVYYVLEGVYAAPDQHAGPEACPGSQDRRPRQ